MYHHIKIVEKLVHFGSVQYSETMSQRDVVVMVLPTRRQFSIGITIMARWNYRQTGLIEHSTSAVTFLMCLSYMTL